MLLEGLVVWVRLSIEYLHFCGEMQIICTEKMLTHKHPKEDREA